MKRLVVFLLALGGACFLLESCATGNTLSGVVRDSSGPVSGAIVRIQTTNEFTLTNNEGEFTFSELPFGESVSLSAWKPGYYIGGGETFPVGTHDIRITLVPLTEEDNPAYLWISASADAGEAENCQNCHAGKENEPLPFDEWQRDPHAHSAENPRFLTMYSGTDMEGHQSPLTRYDFNPDYGRYTLPPDPNQPYYGPGYQLDFPGAAGNCAACHTPAAAVNAPYGTDPRAVSGAGAEGVTCDFCHKVWDVKLNADGLPYPNMPGVLSFEFRRPPQGHQFFAGPYDDVAPGEDTYAPVYTQSRYCAACHFGEFWNVQIYNSFGEWLASPYSDSETGQTCQDCHMPPRGNDHFVRFDKGGRQRDPSTVFSHDMTVTPALLQQAITLQAQAERLENQVTVTVTLTNTGAGHHVPTDSPLRQMILLVQADAAGTSLPLLNGPVLPEWAGVGDASQGYYAGLPGTLYAKTLQEMWTEVTPTGAYWNPTRILSDNRIPALESDTTRYVFDASPIAESSPITIRVQLLYRRAFITLRDQKGWDIPDILMAQQTLTVSK